MDWLLFFVAVIVLSVVIGACVAMLVASVPPENRPAPAGRLAANEEARLRALKTIAARARTREL
jgi:hypothetical protein